MNAKPDSPFLRTILIIALIAICAALRLAPHPWNFTPIGAMAVFAGTTIRNRPWAFVVPLIAMFATDLIIGFNSLSLLVYTSFALSVLISRSLLGGSKAVAGARFGVFVTQRTDRITGPNETGGPGWSNTIARFAGATFLSSLQFFLVTNFGVWAFLGSYPRTAAGLAACYLAGLPLFLNTLAGDFIYTALLFAAFTLASGFVRGRVSVSV